ncbi:hypothetical protein QQG55_43255 [Brugia pahangi]
MCSTSINQYQQSDLRLVTQPYIYINYCSFCNEDIEELRNLFKKKKKMVNLVNILEPVITLGLVNCLISVFK